MAANIEVERLSCVLEIHHAQGRLEQLYQGGLPRDFHLRR